MFCHKCGVIEHDSRDCDQERVMSVVDLAKPRFGGWLGALPCRSSFDIVQCANMEGVEAEEVVEEKNQAAASEVYATKVECSASDMKCDLVSKNKRLFDSIESGMPAGSMVNVVNNEVEKNIPCDALKCDFVEGCVKENLDVNMRCVRRKKAMNVRKMKEVARGGVENMENNEIVCSKMSYYVEFPGEEEGECSRKILSSDV